MGGHPTEVIKKALYGVFSGVELCAAGPKSASLTRLARLPDPFCGFDVITQFNT